MTDKILRVHVSQGKIDVYIGNSKTKIGEEIKYTITLAAIKGACNNGD